MRPRSTTIQAVGGVAEAEQRLRRRQRRRACRAPAPRRASSGGERLPGARGCVAVMASASQCTSGDVGPAVERLPRVGRCQERLGGRLLQAHVPLDLQQQRLDRDPACGAGTRPAVAGEEARPAQRGSAGFGGCTGRGASDRSSRVAAANAARSPPRPAGSSPAPSATFPSSVLLCRCRRHEHAAVPGASGARRPRKHGIGAAAGGRARACQNVRRGLTFCQALTRAMQSSAMYSPSTRVAIGDASCAFDQHDGRAWPSASPRRSCVACAAGAYLYSAPPLPDPARDGARTALAAGRADPRGARAPDDRERPQPDRRR